MHTAHDHVHLQSFKYLSHVSRLRRAGTTNVSSVRLLYDQSRNKTNIRPSLCWAYATRVHSPLSMSISQNCYCRENWAPFDNRNLGSAVSSSLLSLRLFCAPSSIIINNHFDNITCLIFLCIQGNDSHTRQCAISLHAQPLRQLIYSTSSTYPRYAVVRQFRDFSKRNAFHIAIVDE